MLGGETSLLRRIHALFGRPVRAPAAGDAGHSLLDYVQISDFVTKVLIRKRLRQWLPKKELTNLET
jgi:hypothetical protein